MGIGLYSLRHSFATRLDKLGVSTKDIQDLLGHANASTTLNSYTHSDTDSQRGALDTLEEALLAKIGKLGIAEEVVRPFFVRSVRSIAEFCSAFPARSHT
ncbi:MAG: tyrosine-type recombinase/integrase [Gemmatimonas sp.]